MSDAAESQAPCVAVLHVFSGVHLGACVELTEGSWLLGSDDACDLIFNGLAPSHAALEVGVGEGGVVSITVKPRGGQVLVEGAPVEGETPLEAGGAWYLGDTCFAWNLPGVVQRSIVPQSGAPLVADAQAAPDATAEQGVADADSGAEQGTARAVVQSGTPVGEPVDTATSFTPVRMDARPPRPVRQRQRGPVLLVLAALALAALSVTFSTGPSRSEYPALANGILEKAGITGLVVAPRWPGVEVRGAVASAEELERLTLAVQEASFPVYLEVAVDGDMLRAVRNALGVRGFYPVARMERGRGGPRLVVAAFMRDALVEADAFAQLEKDVPPPPLKERRIIHEGEVAPLVLSALQSAGFGDIQPVYLPGRIALDGAPSPDRRAALERLKAGLSAHFGVPLFGEGELPEGATLAAKLRGVSLTPPDRGAPARQERDEQADHDLLGGLKLTGVFTAPLQFVVTEDGHRLFVGAVLPNGNVLESITTTTLTLRRGDKVFTYRLRGKHE